MRKADIERNTKETRIHLSLNLDGKGYCDVRTGVGFLDHMLTLAGFHAGFDLTAVCEGDVAVDDHHSVEDVGIALGEALSSCLGERGGIARYGSFLLPMDEALVLCALDLGGRDCLNFDVRFPTEKIGSFDTQLVKEFFAAFCRSARATLHLKQLAGENSHHIAEACFKAFGRAARQAVAETEGGVASTKGMLV